MGGMVRIGRGAVACVLMASILATNAGASISDDHAGGPPPSHIDRRQLAMASDAGAPDWLTSALGDPKVKLFHDTFSGPWPDLSGDRVDDVMSVDYAVQTSADHVVINESMELAVFNGKNGRKLWSKTYKLGQGWGTPLSARVGSTGRNGVVVLLAEEEKLSFVGLDSSGSQVYSQEFEMARRFPDPVAPYTDVASYGLLDALPGPATDVMVGVADVSEFPTPPGVPGVAAVMTTKVIDGSSGELVTHLEPEIGLGRVPKPMPAPDLDADGLDDVVIAYVLPDVSLDPETGLPEVPNVESEYLRARRGQDGSKIWTSDPLELGEPTESYFDQPYLKIEDALGDVTSDERPDVLLERYPTPFGEFVLSSPDKPARFLFVSGANGSYIWDKEADDSALVGDLDSDGDRELLFANEYKAKKIRGTRLMAYEGTGHVLYERRIPAEADPWGDREWEGVSSDLSLTGDVDVDGTGDVFLYQTLWVSDKNSTMGMTLRPLIVSSLEGRTLGPRLEQDRPLRSSVDGRGTDLMRFPYRGPPSAVRVMDGLTRRMVIRTDLDIPMTLPTEDDWLSSLIAFHADRDPCADLVALVQNDKNSFLAVIDGASGRIKWSHRLVGPDLGDLEQSPPVDANRRC